MVVLYTFRKKSLINKLEQLQFDAIRAALGLRKSTPTNILIAESKLMLIKDRAEMLGTKYLLKVYSSKNGPVYEQSAYMQLGKIKKRKRMLSKIMLQASDLTLNVEVNESYPLNKFEYETQIYTITFNVSLCKKLKVAPNLNHMFNEFLKSQKGLCIFTDGSKMKDKNHVGAACFVPKKQIEVKKSLNYYA